MIRGFSIFLFLSTAVLSCNSFADVVNNNASSIQKEIEQAETNALQQLQQRLPVVPKPESNQNQFPPANSASYSATQTMPNTATTTPSAASPQNPWVKNNPWAAQAKQNPWGNQASSAPTTSATYPTNNNNLPPPPNIFAPNQTNTSSDVSSASTNKK